jgi:hypothetical protein
MTFRFKFPCPHCQQASELSPSQAGQETVCQSCKGSFEAPKLQTLREYPRIGEAVKSVAYADQYLSRAIFSGGLIAALLGLAAGISLYLYANYLSGMVNFDGGMNYISGQAEAINPAEVYREWYFVETMDEFEEWIEHPAVSAQAQGNILKYVAYLLLALGIAGLLAMLGSRLVGQASAPKS